MYTDKELIRLIIPLFGEQFLIVFVGITDTFMVAYAGEAAVSGVALVDTISYLVVVVFSALCTGGAVVASQYNGSGNKDRVALTSRLLLSSTFIIALLVMIITEFFGDGLLAAIFGDVEADVMKSASDYFRLIGYSFPPLAVYSAAAALFRSQGNSAVSLLASTVMNAINIAGNAYFIYVCKMGAAGSGLATLLARGASAAVLCVLLFKDGMLRYLTPHVATFEECRDILGKIFYIGIPSGLESGLFNFGKLLVQRLFASLGTIALAANAAAGSLSTIATLPGGALSIAMLPVVGKAIGAEKPQEARRLTKKLMRSAYILMFAANALVYLFLPQLTGLYSLSEETAGVVRELLLWHCLFATLFYPASFCTPAALRAAGDVGYTMTVSIVSMLVCRVVLSYIFVKVFSFGVLSIWMAIFIDWGVRALLFSLRMRGSAWYKHKLI
jgi:putative MATE family efflux protein